MSLSYRKVMFAVVIVSFFKLLALNAADGCHIITDTVCKYKENNQLHVRLWNNINCSAYFTSVVTLVGKLQTEKRNIADSNLFLSTLYRDRDGYLDVSWHLSHYCSNYCRNAEYLLHYEETDLIYCLANRKTVCLKSLKNQI